MVKTVGTPRERIVGQVTIKLKDIRPNPYKGEILGGHDDPERVAMLRRSIRQTGFWKGMLLQRVDGPGGPAYHLAFGHKRTKAAILEFGGDKEVTLDVADFNDDEMFQAMALENMTAMEETPQGQLDVFRAVRSRLRARFKQDGAVYQVALQDFGPQDAFLGKDSYPDTDERIWAYLGKVGTIERVRELRHLDDVLASPLVRHIRQQPDAPGQLSVTGAVALASLATSSDDRAGKAVQQQVYEILKPGSHQLTTPDVAKIRRALKAGGPNAALRAARGVREIVVAKAATATRKATVTTIGPKKRVKKAARKATVTPQMFFYAEVSMLLPQLRLVHRKLVLLQTKREKCGGQDPLDAPKRHRSTVEEFFSHMNAIEQGFAQLKRPMRTLKVVSKK